MSERENAKKTKELFNLLGEALDARNQHIVDSSPDQSDYYSKLKELEREMWAAHSRWQTSVSGSDAPRS